MTPYQTSDNRSQEGEVMYQLRNGGSALLFALNDRSRTVIADAHEGVFDVRIEPLDEGDERRLRFELAELEIEPQAGLTQLVISGFANLAKLGSLASALDPRVAEQLDALIEATSPLARSAGRWS
jgi:hypothetical protein